MAVTNYHTANGRVISQNSTKDGYQYLLQDPLGNVIATVDDKGTKSNDTTYWPFGEVRTGGVSSVTNFGFCGGWGNYTDSSSKIYVRARYYRPVLGRWQTVDPLWPSKSAYAYVRGDPISFVDPSGRKLEYCNKDTGWWTDPRYHFAFCSSVCANVLGYNRGTKVCCGFGQQGLWCSNANFVKDYNCKEISVSEDVERCLCAKLRAILYDNGGSGSARISIGSGTTYPKTGRGRKAGSTGTFDGQEWQPESGGAGGWKRGSHDCNSFGDSVKHVVGACDAWMNHLGYLQFGRDWYK